MDNKIDFKKTDLDTQSVESNLINFEKNQREFLHELQRKRILLDECRQELNDSISKQHELERKLEIEKRKHEDDIVQMNLAVNVAKKMEEERQQTKDNLVVKSVQLEMAISERDFLFEQIRTMQIENIKLKREVEDLNGKHRCHLVFQKDILDQQNRLKSTIVQLDSSVQNLKREQEKINYLAKKVDELSELELVIKYQEKEKQQYLKEKNVLEKQLVKKIAEMEKLKELYKEYPRRQHKVNKSIAEYWQSQYEELHQQLSKGLEATWQLGETLKHANETNHQLVTNEKRLLAKLKELEYEGGGHREMADGHSQTDGPGGQTTSE